MELKANIKFMLLVAASVASTTAFAQDGPPAFGWTNIINKSTAPYTVTENWSTSGQTPNSTKIVAFTNWFTVGSEKSDADSLNPPFTIRYVNLGTTYTYSSRDVDIDSDGKGYLTLTWEYANTDTSLAKQGWRETSSLLESIRVWMYKILLEN